MRRCRVSPFCYRLVWGRRAPLEKQWFRPICHLRDCSGYRCHWSCHIRLLLFGLSSSVWIIILEFHLLLCLFLLGLNQSDLPSTKAISRSHCSAHFDFTTFVVTTLSLCFLIDSLTDLSYCSFQKTLLNCTTIYSWRMPLQYSYVFSDWCSWLSQSTNDRVNSYSRRLTLRCIFWLCVWALLGKRQVSGGFGCSGRGSFGALVAGLSCFLSGWVFACLWLICSWPAY